MGFPELTDYTYWSDADKMLPASIWSTLSIKSRDFGLMFRPVEKNVYFMEETAAISLKAIFSHIFSF